ncbi:hypothetical protein [Rheinheimera sp. EpRS3]|uniref:hypothetical protein n=1 Tax=Rheinheimera sp. EpRS3 TaxID=1712383 RepID=UPI0012E36313|nr:hypothetical protein [Rheinheimera sp. EpRS3]
MTAIFSITQLLSTVKKNRYDEIKSIPQIEIFRRSDLSGDYIEVVNRGGEAFNVVGKVATFLQVQANLSPVPSQGMFYVPAYFSRPKMLNSPEMQVILQSASARSHEVQDGQWLQFAVDMTKDGYPSAGSLSHFISLEYFDIFGKEYKRCYSLRNPGLPASENDSKCELVDILYIMENYKWLERNEEPHSFAKSWVKSEFENKRSE